MVNISNEEIFRLMHSQEAEREILCQAFLGKSFSEARPELAYELFIRKTLAHDWAITHVDCTNFDSKCPCINVKTISIDSTRPAEQYDLKLYPFQVDSRLVDAMRYFAWQSCGYMSNGPNFKIDSNPLVRMAMRMVELGGNK